MVHLATFSSALPREAAGLTSDDIQGDTNKATMPLHSQGNQGIQGSRQHSDNSSAFQEIQGFSVTGAACCKLVR
jgi:hypothetical protein